MDNFTSRLLSLWVSLIALYECGASVDVSYRGDGMSDAIKFKELRRFTRQGIVSEVVNVTRQDNHTYYTSTFHPPGSPMANQLWFDLSSRDDIEIHPETGISQSFRVFDTHDLRFDFPFYGHTINLVAVTTGGFLYASDYLHSRIHLTQYIAPLQADFNPSLNDSARVLVYSGTERFTVQWDNVHVAGHVADGTFTFQVSLFRNGTIHFVYRNMPLRVSDISDANHPVEVGVADSFYLDRPIPPNLILRQVFEYSRIQLQTLNDNLNYSAYVLKPNPGCVEADSCDACITATQTTAFTCGWCSDLNRCSDGVDRFRQDWFEAGCQNSNSTSCKVPTSPVPVILTEGAALSTEAVAGIVVSVFVVLLLLVLIVGVCVGIIVYGYKNPNSSLGLFLIEHRPKARTLNKGTASYDVSSGKANLTES